MAKKKKYRGHYCIVCGEIKANEKFTGKGHRSHVCKQCSKKSESQRAEEIVINRIYKLTRYSNLSKQNRKMLEGYLQDERERVRMASQEIIERFTFKFRDKRDKEDESIYFLDTNYMDFSDEPEYIFSDENIFLDEDDYDLDDMPF